MDPRDGRKEDPGEELGRAATAPDGVVEVRGVERHTDARGAVFEPMHGRALSKQRNVHVVLTRPGCVRGNHLHRHGTEVLVVEGPGRVRYRDRNGLRDVELTAGEVASFTIPPGVPHAVLATGDRPQLLVAFRDVAHDPDDPDVEPVELL